MINRTGKMTSAKKIFFYKIKVCKLGSNGSNLGLRWIPFEQNLTNVKRSNIFLMDLRAIMGAQGCILTSKSVFFIF